MTSWATRRGPRAIGMAIRNSIPGDFVTALEYGGYEVGPRQAVAAVPEPAAALSVSAALALMVFTRRRTSRRAA